MVTRGRILRGEKSRSQTRVSLAPGPTLRYYRPEPLLDLLPPLPIPDEPLPVEPDPPELVIGPPGP